MLVLSRKIGEKIKIGSAIVQVLEVTRGKVRLGIIAPPDVTIKRLDDLGQQPQQGDHDDAPSPE